MTARGSAPLQVRRLFDAACVVEEGTPELLDGQLFPEELDYVALAVPKRRAEFGAARVCARRALQQLGAAAVSLVPGDDRAPRWPPGFVGSITHTQHYCAAVVARCSELQSVGIDAERDRRIACTKRSASNQGSPRWRADSCVSVVS